MSPRLHTRASELQPLRLTPQIRKHATAMDMRSTTTTTSSTRPLSIPHVRRRQPRVCCSGSEAPPWIRPLLLTSARFFFSRARPHAADRCSPTLRRGSHAPAPPCSSSLHAATTEKDHAGPHHQAQHGDHLPHQQQPHLEHRRRQH